jgi:hypothetical protein
MATEFRRPDVKAPRFRQESLNITSKEFCVKFREKHPKHKSMSDTQIKDIIKAFNETLWETVIETRDGVQLPEGIGYIFIGTCQAAKSKNVDYAKSRKYGVPVSNNNWETDGKLAKIFYSSYASKYKFAFRECWSFTACRNFKRMVAKTYPENWTMYVQIDSNKKMRDMYTTITMKSKILREQAVKLKTYNEFDL